MFAKQNSSFSPQNTLSKACSISNHQDIQAQHIFLSFVVLRSLSRTWASVCLLEVSIVHLAFVQTFSLLKAIQLPYFTFLIKQSALFQVWIPFCSILTRRNGARFTSDVIKRSLRWTGTSIIVFVVGLILLTFLFATSWREIVKLPFITGHSQGTAIS